MSALAFLIPTSLLLGLIGLGCFIWSLRSRQYEDLDGAAERILIDDEAECLGRSCRDHSTQLDSAVAAASSRVVIAGLDVAGQLGHGRELAQRRL
jgi:cbb3-type cytochrome oxidase maturation protein